MLKIAVVTRYFPSSAEPWQGRSAYQTLRVLARKADVQVFFPNAKYPSWLKPRSRTYDSLDPTYRPPDVKVIYQNYPAVPLLSRPMNGWMAAHALLPQIRRFGPDILHSFFLYPEGYAALKIGKALSIPVVAKGIGSDVNRVGHGISAMHTRRLLSEVDFLFTVCDDLRRKAIALGADPVRSRSLINGCDLSVFRVMNRAAAKRKLGIDPNVEAIVYVGRMDVKKGLCELVEAAAELHPGRPRMHVYMVGAGPDKPIVEGVIRTNNASSYIHLMPSCGFDEVPEWMAAADLVTLPSYMEGCPNVVIEALASGRPVVATDVGGIPEILNNECGRLVPPRDPAALAKALGEVLDIAWDPATISAQRGRSWDDVAMELLEVLESVVDRHKAGMHSNS